MHKYWARRPWKVFRELIYAFTKPGDIILDPFAGGGVTPVEGLIARRKVIAVDLNPLAIKIMRHEVEPLDVSSYLNAIRELSEALEPLASSLYSLRCPRCGERATALWAERDSATDEPIIVSYECARCGSRGTKRPEPGDMPEPREAPAVRRVRIPLGDKTLDLIKRGYEHFDELLTRRNLYMMIKIMEGIERLSIDDRIRSFLLFTLSSALKWASKMSHRRGDIIEGWALHAYWIYPRYLEINLWRQFLNRARAVVRGKSYTNRLIGSYAVEAREFEELRRGASYMLLQADSRRLPMIPDGSVDAVITDPPYGGNVNYAELSDYFLWPFGELSPKREEIVINGTRGYDIYDYHRGLQEVFSECYRVLRSGGLFISTFNSKSSLVLGAFIQAAVRAGLSFAGAVLQPYLRAYETTFHALQPNAMTFDYVFFFYKSDGVSGHSAKGRWDAVVERVEECSGCAEREMRIRAYPELMKIFASLQSMEEVARISRDFERLIRSASRSPK